MWAMYTKAVASFWVVDEIDLSHDRNGWDRLSEGERTFIKHVLAFFASADGIVMENLNVNFADEIQVAEARQFYAYQSFSESVHSHAYGVLLDTYIDDPVEKRHLFTAIETIPSVAGKASFASKYMHRSQSFATRLLAFACVEGILFSGSFCSIFWLKKRGLMPGLCTSNAYIARDEGLHVDFAALVFTSLKHRLTTKKAHSIVKEAVTVETEFITEALPCALIGMNAELMTQYIRYVADRLLKQLKYPPMWNVENPFGFMEQISLQGKANFFETRVTEYAKSGVGSTTDDKKFDLTDDF
jgi:ribonucleotide reductase beta subunit family protein with ferritin-like domain